MLLKTILKMSFNTYNFSKWLVNKIFHLSRPRKGLEQLSNVPSHIAVLLAPS